MSDPIIEYYDNGNKFSEHYIVNGQFHRDPLEGPADIWYHENGNKKYEQYYLNGKRHRDPEIGPADIWYHENGNKKYEHYYLNGKRHRDPEQGPAFFQYYSDGSIELEEYWVNNKIHNPYGPAYNDYDDDVFEWYLNDIQYTEEVNEYLGKHELNWQSMDHTDFDIMWAIIL